MRGLLVSFLVLLTGTASLPLYAADVSVPHQFVGGQKAVAEEVNENFRVLAKALSDALDRIELLEAQNTQLTNELADIKDADVQLAKALTDITDSTIWKLNDYVELLEDEPEVYGYRTVRFSSVNLQVVDGTGKTQKGRDDTNGLGNIVIGYNEERVGRPLCSLGQYRDEGECTFNGGEWVVNHKSGSHNLVVGPGHAYSASAGSVVGTDNVITGFAASVVAGRLNMALREHSSVSGGASNRAFGYASTVSGGTVNTALGDMSSVSGGFANQAEGAYSSISGGSENTTEGYASSIIGGSGYTARDSESIAPNPLP